jgi:hypothetical protein
MDVLVTIKSGLSLSQFKILFVRDASISELRTA